MLGILQGKEHTATGLLGRLALLTYRANVTWRCLYVTAMLDERTSA
ncbi:hypothetical protein CHCC14817_3279 [Bacillus paralicheniformis]|nr:hypothetical protein CHCC14817_3279 [Bacillus paralicheniformis]